MGNEQYVFAQGQAATEEDAIERKTILNYIYTNNIEGLMNMKVISKNLNWLEAHPRTDLDELISPLTCAAFLGRFQVLELLLQSPTIDLELTTQENEYSALQVACMGGHLDCVQFLAENGADVNFMNSQGQTPLIHCFSRITETENMFENRNICLLMAEVLLKNGANINQLSNGRTILMQFCALTMRLD
jgi:ankyrin repeat protein